MKRRRNRRRNSTKLSFDKLEPRQLLAGDVLGAHQASGAIPAGANLVINGDFEDLGSDTDNFYSDNDVAGWVAENSSTGQEVNIFNYDSVYENVLDLDSTGSVFDIIYQDINTNAGDNYVIAFDYAIHPTELADATEKTNAFLVWWDGNVVGEFTGADYWQTGVIPVVGGDADATRLLFCEIEEGLNNAGDGLGALLDNIRVVKVNELSIDNGSFETNSADRDLFYHPEDVDSWSAINPEVNDRWLKIVEQDETLATDGTQYLNLDATAETRDMIYTDIATTEGQTYFVSFDMRTDGNPANDADQLRVRWNTPRTTAGDASQWAGTIIGNSEWSKYGLVLTAESAETRLMFLEPGDTTGDGSGPLIDNVRIFAIETSNLVADGNGSDTAGTSGTDTFIPKLGAQRVAEAIELSHPDNDGTLTSATITLNNTVDGNNEIVAISNSSIPVDENDVPKINSLGYDSATKQLVLTGEATAAEYQQVLRSLTYYNTSDVVSVADRTVNIEIADSSLPSGRSSTTTNIVVGVETDQAVIDDAILQKYIADNDLVTESYTTADGIGPMYYIVNDPGTGLNPTQNDTVRVAYTGNTLEVNSQNKVVKGDQFETNDNAQFPLSGVIRGWQEGIPLIKNGGSITLMIPSALAYGPSGHPASGDFANEILLFDVDLLQIV